MRSSYFFSSCHVKMSYTLMIAFALATSSSCTKFEMENPDSGCPEDSTCVYWYADSNSVVPIPAFPEVPAHKNRFAYEITFIDDPRIADDELLEFITFEAPKEWSNFNFTHLEDIEVYYGRRCYCPIDNPIKIEDGYLSGWKISDTEWIISGAMTFAVYGQQENFTIKNQRFRKI